MQKKKKKNLESVRWGKKKDDDKEVKIWNIFAQNRIFVPMLKKWNKYVFYGIFGRYATSNT